MKKISNPFRQIANRIGIFIIIFITELIIFGVSFAYLKTNFIWIESLLHIIAILIILGIIRTSKHLSSDLMLIILIVLFPVGGTLVFAILFLSLFFSATAKSLVIEAKVMKQSLYQDEKVIKKLNDSYPNLRGDFYYLYKSEGFPFYENDSFDYYPLGDDGFPIMLEELKKAKKFILLEYFIIEEGVMWDQILAILKEKAEEGVDVRLLYDDLGSLFTLPLTYEAKLNSYGIKAYAFNRVNPFLSLIMNHRDHRKIMVIDGKVAFSGGINLADEYINVIAKHGHWKDNIIRVKGKAVDSFTKIFFSTYTAVSQRSENITPFLNHYEESDTKDGYICPYASTPLDDEKTGQNVYLNILNGAKDYVYIMTPYLIIDTDMINTLLLAVKRGVKVCILTPGIPDKKTVYRVTRSYYRQLIQGGVEVYEYTPGFVHAKVFVSDDKVATVGTINLDYRSLYLHFENGVYLVGSKKVMDIKKDFLDTIKKSHKVNQSELKQNFFLDLYDDLLRIFAPMF